MSLLEGLLRKHGYTNLQSTTEAREVVTRYLEFHPDLLLLDLSMPYTDGFEVMEKLNVLIPFGTYFPILVLTADVTAGFRTRLWQPEQKII